MSAIQNESYYNPETQQYLVDNPYEQPPYKTAQSKLQEAYNRMRQFGEDAWDSPRRKYWLPVTGEEWADVPVEFGRTARRVYDAGANGAKAMYDASSAPVRTMYDIAMAPNRAVFAIGQQIKKGWDEETPVEYTRIDEPQPYVEPSIVIRRPVEYAPDGTWRQQPMRLEHIGEGWDY